MIKSVRIKEKKTLTKLYCGIRWKSLEQSTCSLSDIKSLLGVDFFLIHESERNVKVGHHNGYLVNGLKMLTEVIFHADGYLEVVVCNKSINTNEIQLKNEFMFNSKSISGLLDGIRNVKLCEGFVPVKNSKYLITLPEGALQEQWTDKDGKIMIKIKSTACKQLLPFTSTKLVCDMCCSISNQCFPNLDLMKPDNTSSISIQNQPSNSHVILTENSHKDMMEVLNYVLPQVPDRMATFIKSQTDSVSTSPMARRWNKDILRMCLSLYCRSPKAFEELHNSGFVVLPSQRLLRQYKNQVTQEAGISKEILKWMCQIAKNQNICKEGYEGGLLIDEMAIQEDLQFQRRGEDYELIGFSETVQEAKSMSTILTKRETVSLANHVLQLVFLGNTGFRFPLAHFPTTQASASKIYLIFFKAVKMLGLFGFSVRYLSLDGAQTNRDLMKMLLRENVSKTMTFNNVFDDKLSQICVIMDYSHVMKKIRNNISKSGTSLSHKRHLQLDSNSILWEHWYKAYQWDVYSNPLKVYQQLTQDHFFLNSQLKMRNRLAEDVMNQDMLHLMKCYQKSLGDD